MIGGIPESVAATLVRAVSGDTELDTDSVVDRFARAAWSCIAEPGDGDVGRMLETYGSVESLRLVTSGVTAEVLVDEFGFEPAPDDDTSEPALIPPVGPDAKALQHWRDALTRWQPRINAELPTMALRQAARFGARLIVPNDPAWPIGLADLDVHQPTALWVRGDPERLAALDRSVALVGARAATGYGEHVTVEAASGLVDRGFAVVSGAAYGIDGVAHRAALASQGITVAVMAGGIDRFYPSGHETLLTRIVERGVVVTEVPPGTAPTRWRFLQRNRIIAAISQATVVVEAGWRSGSINTAHHAAKAGRPVGAVPGPVTSAASAGCHKLLRDFATCVTTADEMAELALLGDGAALYNHPGITRKRPKIDTFDDSLLDPERRATRTRILDAMSVRTPRSADQLATLSGLAVDRVQAELGHLELEGTVRFGPSGWSRFPAPKADD